MKIYPKISAQAYCDEMKKKLQKSEGLEIQFFDQNGITSSFNFEDEVRKNKALYPDIKEIVVHPPLDNYNIELIFMKDENIFKNQLEKLVELSKELDIDMSFIYHTYWPVRQFISTGLDKRIRECIKIIEGTNVTVLIENLFMMLDEKEECSAIEICKHLDHPNVRACIDTTHMHCKANILRKDFYTMIEKELKPEDCKKYVKQIHFAAALNNDGYTDKKTHGRKHPNIDELKAEYDWLVKFGMGDKHFITEVGEEDYFSRADQLEEIKMLEEV